MTDADCVRTGRYSFLIGEGQADVIAPDGQVTSFENPNDCARAVDLLNAVRAGAVEECKKIAEAEIHRGNCDCDYSKCAEHIADRIRALLKPSSPPAPEAECGTGRNPHQLERDSRVCINCGKDVDE